MDHPVRARRAARRGMTRCREFSASRRTLLAAGLALLLAGRTRLAGAADLERFLGPGMPYAAFDELPATALSVPGGAVRVGFAPGDFDLPKARILKWVADAADSVARYYGRFPVADARLLIVPFDGRGVRSGTAFAYAGAAIRVRLG